MRDVFISDLDQLERQADEAAVALDMDEETFRLFYQRTSRPLWAYLSRVSRDRQLADDLLQEAYYRLLKSGRRFDSDEHRRHYLFRIATNLVLDARRRPQPSFSELPGESDTRAPRAGDGGDQAIRRADLSAALGRLAPRDRALLWLAYAQGASHGEIAASTGLKASSVKQLLFRARRRLAALMGGVR
jgi:RNA polymerase sigma-70 factor (ECF subfamily)